MLKRFLNLLIVLLLSITVLHMNIKEPEAVTLVQNKMVTIALKEKGSRYKKKYGARPWCAAFVNWAARNAKVSTKVIPKTSDSTTMYKLLLKNGGKIVKKPQKGDLVFYKRSAKSTKMMHVAIMTSSTMSIHGNYSKKVSYIKATDYQNGKKKIAKNRIVYVRPNYPKAPSAPTISKATIKDQTITLSWNKVKNASSYTVYMKDTHNKIVYQKKTTSNKLSFVYNGKTSGTYSLLLKAHNNIGSSANSQVKKIKYIVPEPVLPSDTEIN